MTCISPAAGLHPEVAHRIAHGQVTHVDRLFSAPDLDDPAISMVLVAIDDAAASSEIWRLCRARRIPANIADVPPECDFYFGSIHRDGPLQVMVSTNGKSPKLANIIRTRIEEAIPARAGAAIDNVGVLRERLKERAPGVGGDVSRRRMRWMVELCTAWEMDELAELDDARIEHMLLEGWEKNLVLSPRELGIVRKE